jgi:hypothetical protein
MPKDPEGQKRPANVIGNVAKHGSNERTVTTMAHLGLRTG